MCHTPFSAVSLCHTFLGCHTPFCCMLVPHPLLGCHTPFCCMLVPHPPFRLLHPFCCMFVPHPLFSSGGTGARESHGDDTRGGETPCPPSLTVCSSGWREGGRRRTLRHWLGTSRGHWWVSGGRGPCECVRMWRCECVRMWGCEGVWGYESMCECVKCS